GPSPVRRAGVVLLALVLSGAAVLGLWTAFRPAPQPRPISSGTNGPSSPLSSGRFPIGYNPCPSLPCSLLDTYKVTYRLSDGSLVGMDAYKFDPSDPSAGPAPGP